MHDDRDQYNRGYDQRSGHRGQQGGGYGGQGPGGHGGGQRRGVPLSDLDPALTDCSRKLIGAAIEVHRALGPGYPTEIYLNALKTEMASLGVAAEFNAPIDVSYKGAKVGTTRADLFVDKRFLATLLNRPGEIGGYERAVLRSQLKAADLELGLIINFGERRLKDGLVRVLNIEKLNAGRGEEGFEDEHDAGETVGFS